MKTLHRNCLLLAVIAVTLSGCGKSDPAAELEKAAGVMEKLEKAPTVASGDYDPAVAASLPAKQMKEAVVEFKAGKMEDAVTRLQVLRSQTTMTPEQRMAMQDGVAAIMAEIYSLAEKGDARAIAAVAQYEKMQSGQR